MNTKFMGLDGFFWFQGIVENISEDPHKIGNVQVRIFGIHSDSKIPNDHSGQGIPTEDLPWAQISCNTSSASTSGIGESPVGIVNGTLVWGFSRDGRDYTDLVVCGTFAGIPQNKSTGKGFMDPDKVYPTRTMESDLSRLTRGDIKKTWVEQYNANLKSNPLFTQPKSPYAATYPNNHVITTKSGHTFERDDTPSFERISWMHRTGTGTEVFPDGTRSETIVKDNYKVVAGEECLHVEGNVKIYVKGNVTQVIDGSVNQKIKGNVVETINGSKDCTSKGPMNFKASAITMDAPVTTTSTMAVKDSITSKMVTGTKDVMGGNKSVKGHSHTGNAGRPVSPPT